MKAPDGTAYERFGPDEKPVIVLIHGLGLNRQVWQWQVPALSKKFQVLTYDLYGHGETPPAGSEPSLQQFADQTASLLEATGVDKCAVIGFSLGGMIARKFTQNHPSRVAALAILNSPHRRSKSAQAAILARVGQASEAGPESTVEAALERWFTPQFRSDHPEVMNLVRSWVLSNHPTIYPANYRVLAEGVDEIVAPEPPISCPTLVVTAEDDFGNGPEMTRAIAAEIEGAQTAILPGLRHMALAEAPELINDTLIRFFSRIS